MEIAICIEVDTGVAIGGLGTDLHTKAKRTEMTIRYLCTKHGASIQDHLGQDSYGKILRPRLVRCTRALTGQAHRGYTRRPHWIQGDIIETIIAIKLQNAKA